MRSPLTSRLPILLRTGLIAILALLVLNKRTEAEPPENPAAPAPTKVSPLPNEQNPPRDAMQFLLDERRAKVRDLEARWKALREETEAHLADVALVPEEEVKLAKKRHQEAALARELSEIAINEYTESIVPQQLMTLKGEIQLAEGDLARTKIRLAEMQEWLEQAKQIKPNRDKNELEPDLDRLKEIVAGFELNLGEGKVVQAELEFQRAGFQKEQAELALEVFETYTKNKEVKKLREKADQAKAVELEALKRWEALKENLKDRKERSARLGSKVSEVHVAAFLEEAAALQAQAVTLLGTIPAADANQPADPKAVAPAPAKQDAEQIQKTLNEALELQKQAAAKVVQALDLAKLVQLWRTQLSELEAEYRKAQDDLARLEKIAPAR